MNMTRNRSHPGTLPLQSGTAKTFRRSLFRLAFGLGATVPLLLIGEGIAYAAAALTATGNPESMDVHLTGLGPSDECAIYTDGSTDATVSGHPDDSSGNKDFTRIGEPAGAHTLKAICTKPGNITYTLGPITVIVGTAATGTRYGNWTSQGQSSDATLALDSVNPIKGQVYLHKQGCTATWTETERVSEFVRKVHAFVHGGPCSDNDWMVTIVPPDVQKGIKGSITGVDASPNGKGQITFPYTPDVSGP